MPHYLTVSYIIPLVACQVWGLICTADAGAQQNSVVSVGQETVLFADSFGNALDGGWSWLREQPARWRLHAGGLEMRLMPGLADTVENALLRRVVRPTDGAGLAIEVTVVQWAQPVQQYEQAGLTWYRDGQPVFKFVKELVDGAVVMIPGRKPIEGDTVQLRLEVAGSRYTAKYRRPGQREFDIADRGDLPAGGVEQISLQGYHGPADKEHWVRFEAFRMLRIP